MIFSAYRMESEDFGPDSIVLTKPTGREFEELKLELPEGYRLSETAFGMDALYDERGYYCDLCPALKGPGILAVSATRQKGLKMATEEDPVPLHIARKAAGLTQVQLAEISGVSNAKISRIEAGIIKIENLTAKNFMALANALGVDPSTLLTGKEEQTVEGADHD